MDDDVYVTGLAIVNGGGCDSLSWVMTPRAERMMVTYYDVPCGPSPKCENLLYGVVEDKDTIYYSVYAGPDGQNKVVEHKRKYTWYEPALCKTDMPKDYTWAGLMSVSKKMNVNHVVHPLVNPVDYRYGPKHIKIFIPKQALAPYLSEIILLYDKRVQPLIPNPTD